MSLHLHRLAAALFLMFVVNAPATVLYVDLNSPSPSPPYTNWVTAATNIQDAVGAAAAGDSILVTNGVYQSGGVVVVGQETNRVALTNAIALFSVNGPRETIIVGSTQTRCAYVGSNSVLSGFTLTNGQAVYNGDFALEMSGGGVWSESGGVVTNCIIRGNSSSGASRAGGGAYGGVLYNCTLTGNTAGPGGTQSPCHGLRSCAASHRPFRRGRGGWIESW
jgi:hypothetical protein